MSRPYLCQWQGGPGIARHDRRSVLSKPALGAKLTTYVSRDLAFFGNIRLDFIDSTHTNTPVLVLIHAHVSEVQNKDKILIEGDFPFAGDMVNVNA
jgi:hypothetical protein